MNYPFEFKELNITDRVLDKLSFSEYSSGCGDYGERRLRGEGVVYEILVMDEKDDGADGYGSWSPEYLAQYYLGDKVDGIRPAMYFIHELYENIALSNPKLLDLFISKCKENNMYPFIESYLNWKIKNE